MGDPNSSKPGSRPGPSHSGPLEQSNRGAPEKTAAPAGRVVHDERGNAVWDWMKDAARVAIDSTSRVLKRLEVPELKLEDPGDAAARGEAGGGGTLSDPGGGYDPYGKGVTRKPKR